MSPTLRIIFDVNREKSFDVIGKRAFVGRSKEAEIQINHSSVSRKHCVIELRGSDYEITDLDSLNGTFVKNEKAIRTKLVNGSKIQIGDFSAIFEHPQMDSRRLAGTLLDEVEIQLPTDAIIQPVSKSVAGITRDLRGLLNIATQINVIREVDQLQKQILKQIFDMVPADDGALITVGEDLEFEEVVGLSRVNGGLGVPLSRTIVRQVVKERSAILARDVLRDNRKLQTESLAIAGAVSLLCVPLVLFEAVTGVIYLTTNESDNGFDQSHLQLITAVSSIASVAIENARNFSVLKSENERLRARSLSNNMIGDSKVMKDVFARIAKIAPTDTTVLIGGESGTGKELAARSIHSNSDRSKKPFVVINCAAITETLLESELFGHERGAFTGAAVRKKGKIEKADKGTLFLDEIGELAPSIQAKLLRVLQEREFERVGGTKPISVDIRLLAATNRNLDSDVEEGKFREDLYYRLNVIHLVMPPLRQREDDVVILAEEFLAKFNRQTSRRVKGLSSKTKKLLRKYRFPGNVRELENAIESAVVLGVSDWIQPEDLPETFTRQSAPNVAQTRTNLPSLQEGIREAKKQLIHRAFSEAKGNYVKTAGLLDVHPNYLHRLIRVLNIKSELTSKI